MYFYLKTDSVYRLFSDNYIYATCGYIKKSY